MSGMRHYSFENSSRRFVYIAYVTVEALSSAQLEELESSVFILRIGIRSASVRLLVQSLDRVPSDGDESHCTRNR